MPDEIHAFGQFGRAIPVAKAKVRDIEICSKETPISTAFRPLLSWSSGDRGLSFVFIQVDFLLLI